MQQSKCVTNEKRFKNNRHRLLAGFKSLAKTNFDVFKHVLKCLLKKKMLHTDFVNESQHLFVELIS